MELARVEGQIVATAKTSRLTGTKLLLLNLINAADMSATKNYENDGNYFARLALLETAKNLPLGAVWDYYCLKNDVPVGTAWLNEVQRYEKDVQLKRV